MDNVTRALRVTGQSFDIRATVRRRQRWLQYILWYLSSTNGRRKVWAQIRCCTPVEFNWEKRKPLRKLVNDWR